MQIAKRWNIYARHVRRLSCLDLLQPNEFEVLINIRKAQRGPLFCELSHIRVSVEWRWLYGQYLSPDFLGKINKQFITTYARSSSINVPWVPMEWTLDHPILY